MGQMEKSRFDIRSVVTSLHWYGGSTGPDATYPLHQRNGYIAVYIWLVDCTNSSEFEAASQKVKGSVPGFGH